MTDIVDAIADKLLKDHLTLMKENYRLKETLSMAGRNGLEMLKEIDRLHQVCRDAYEVWAGSEGIPEPETAAEAYVYQLLIQMRDEVKEGLK